MSQDQVVTLLQDAVSVVLTCAMPMIGVGLVVGIVISIFQAATQINEQTLTFVPKIIAILVVFLITAGWMMTQLSEFTLRVFDYIGIWIT